MRNRLSLVADIWGVGGAISLSVLTIAVTITSSAFIVIIAETPKARVLDSTTVALLVGAALACSYLLLILVAWAGSRASGLSLAEGVGLRRVPLGRTLAIGLFAALASRAAAGVYAILVQSAGIEIDTRGIDPTRLLPTNPAGVVLTVLLVVVLAPAAEEIVFRGVLMGTLARRWGAVWAVGISSAIFASLHVVPFAMPPIFLLAIVLSLVFIRTRSLWAPIAAHALFNGIGLVAAYAMSGWFGT